MIRSVETAALGSAESVAGDTVDRTITDRRITESSGLAVGLLHPQVLYTHNDSGHPPRIYAIGANGSTEAVLSLPTEPNTDWEAITILRAPAGTRAAGRDLSGQSLLAIGDFGDNNAQRDSIRIALVPEPERLRSASPEPVRVLRLRYPDGPRDAEALLADPRNGRLYVVSKNLFGSQLFAVPERLWPGTGEEPGARVSPVTTMTSVAAMSANLVTDGTFLPDGKLLLRGYGRMHVVDRPESVENGRLRTLASQPLPEQEQGESIAVTDNGRTALIGSEGVRQDVLRIPVPTDTASEPDSTATLPPDPAAGTDSADPADNSAGGIADNSAGSTAVPTAGATVAGGGSPTTTRAIGWIGDLRSGVLLLGAVLMVAAIGFGVAMLRTHAPRGGRR